MSQFRKLDAINAPVTGETENVERMSASDDFYDSQKGVQRAQYFSSNPTNDGTTNLLIDLIADKINELDGDSISILDLGTGNGFLLREVAKRIPSERFCSGVFHGIDTSIDMIAIAREDDLGGRLIFDVADNNKTNWQDQTFDFVIAKAVSNISEAEISRLLRLGGWFFYKEYGPGKGLLELFSHLPPMQHPADIVASTLRSLGFSFIQTRKFFVPLRRRQNEVRATLEMMRVLPHDTPLATAQTLVDQYFNGDSEKLVTSDPFIIEARK